MTPRDPTDNTEPWGNWRVYVNGVECNFIRGISFDRTPGHNPPGPHADRNAKKRRRKRS